MLQTNYSLDIYQYSFQELLNLFDLSLNMTIEDLKQAKRKVLLLHPDKSKLDSKFFLFYKKAFEKIVNYYNETNKQNQTISAENTVYKANEQDKHFQQTILKTMKKTDEHKFQEWFNEEFEKNNIKKNSAKNQWFHEDAPVYDVPDKIAANNIHATFEKIKQQKYDLIPFRDVETIDTICNKSNSYYDEDDDSSFISSNPFSKLKFDDLRKVHKEETIFSVSETDLSKQKQYNSMDHLIQERGKQQLSPMQKNQAEIFLQQQQEEMKQKQVKQHFKSNLQTDQYEEINKQIISKFLQLK